MSMNWTPFPVMSALLALLVACGKHGSGPPATDQSARKLFPIYAYGKWGYIDRQGAVRVEPTFDYAGEFQEGLAAVLIEDKSGYVDESGKLVIPPRFDRAGDFREGRAPVVQDRTIGFVDRQGTFKACLAEDFGTWPDSLSLALQTKESSEGLTRFEVGQGRGRRYGYKDSVGTVVIEPRFEYVSAFCGGLASAILDAEMMYIDRTGRIVWRPQYAVSLEKATCDWSPERAHFPWCVKRYRGPYKFIAVVSATPGKPWTIEVRRDGSLVHSWSGHDGSVFEVDGDVLYYAEFNSQAPGCAVVAHDLKNRRRLWRTVLQAAGVVNESPYSNQVNLVCEGATITVFGKEWRRYIEVLDARTGRILGHRIVKE